MSPRALLTGVLAVVAIVGIGVSVAGCGDKPKPRAPSPAELLTTQQLIGQRIIAGFSGPKPPKKLLAAVRSGKVGGVILFADNTPSKLITQRTTRLLQRKALAGKQPYLLVMTDQEGGDVKRLAWAPPKHSPMAIARSADPAAAAQEAGTLTGAALRTAGVNVDLAPVADVTPAAIAISATTPPAAATSATGATPATAPATGSTGPTPTAAGPTSATPASFLGSRSFGSDPKTVARSACAFATGLQNAAVAATFKHFPGLGRAQLNTDFNAVDVTAPKGRLKRDLRPYTTCPDTPMLVMISSAKYPSLGIGKAAAMTPATYDLLAGTGFNGVTITDAYDTTAIKSYANAARRALSAGADLLLYGQTTHRATDAYDSLLADAKSGQLKQRDLRAAAERILALKRQLKNGTWTPR